MSARVWMVGVVLVVVSGVARGQGVDLRLGEGVVGERLSSLSAVAGVGGYEFGALSLEGGGGVEARVSLPVLDGRSGHETYRLEGRGMSFGGRALEVVELRGDGVLRLDFVEGEDLELEGVRGTASGSLQFVARGSALGLRVGVDGTLMGAGLRGKAAGLRSWREWPPSFEAVAGALLGVEDFAAGERERGGLRFVVNGALGGRGEVVAASGWEDVSAASAPAVPAASAPASRGLAGTISEDINGLRYELERRVDGALGAVVGGGRVLERGDEGGAVEELQRRLKALGYPAPVSGRFDNQTATALGLFQEKNDVAKTHCLGPTTLEALASAERRGGGVLELAVASGEVLERGDEGAAVEALQRRLKKLGFPAPVNGRFDNDTAYALGLFQEKNGVAKTHRFGPTTLEALEGAEAGGETELGRRLAASARRVATRRGTTGWCYAGVADAVTAVMGSFLYGGSAYMAADQLARRSEFREVRGLEGAALRSLPPGAIVVWGKTSRSPNGHISVALGGGEEASDHVARQITNLRGATRPRVFLPR